jgi:NDP-sugar pyrophosphorylase family protein
LQTVILAAGKGTRLYPITRHRSKAMLPIVGKPIVERILDQMAPNGIEDFILVISSEDECIRRYFQDRAEKWGRIRFAYQEERVGSAQALNCAAALINGDFIVSACDNLTSAGHVARMLEVWQSEPRQDAVLSIMPADPRRISQVGIVEMEGRQVKRIVEKPNPDQAPSNIASLPLYCFSTRILDLLSAVPLSIRGEYELPSAIQMLIDQGGQVTGVNTDQRLTLTNPEDLLSINLYYLTHSDEALEAAPDQVGANTRLIPPVCVEAGTVIGQDCTIGPTVYIEPDCQIGDRVQLRDAVVLRHSKVPDGTRMIRQVHFEA